MATGSEEKAARTALPTELPCDDAPRLGGLLSRLEPRLTAVALRLVRRPDAASDVVQNAFEKVLRHCDRFRGTARPSTWMHRIVVNEAFMWLRSESRRAAGRIHPRDWELHFGEADDPEEIVALRERGSRLRRALAFLPPQERAVLTESVVKGRAYATLARDLGVSTGAVKSRAFRARRRLAVELAARD